MADLNQLQSNLSGAESRYQSESAKLSGLQSELPSMADKLRDALTSRLENPLFGQRAQAIQQFFEAAPKAREEVPGLLGAEGAPARPQAVESLDSQRRSAALTPVMGLTGLIGAQAGGIEDVINRGTNAFNSLVAGQQGQVSLAKGGVDMALQALVQAQQAQQQEKENEQWAKKMELDWYNALNPSGGGSSPIVINAGAIPTNNQTPTESKPLYSANQIGAMSAGGQWIFTGDDWVSVSDLELIQ